MGTKTIKVTEYYHTPDYERNYEKSCYEDYICECCGRKLNPKTMKQIQMLESGHWTDEIQEVKSIEGDAGIHSQGFFYIGPKCYKEIMGRIKNGGETLSVEI